MLNDEEIDELVHTNFKAFQCFLRGFGSGYSEGLAAARLSQEQAADLAARKFYAMETWEVENRRRCQIDREFIDVLKHRARQDRAHTGKAAA